MFWRQTFLSLLWGLRQEYNGNSHMSKYLKFVTQALKMLNKMCPSLVH